MIQIWIRTSRDFVGSWKHNIIFMFSSDGKKYTYLRVFFKKKLISFFKPKILYRKVFLIKTSQTNRIYLSLEFITSKILIKLKILI